MKIFRIPPYSPNGYGIRENINNGETELTLIYDEVEILFTSTCSIYAFLNLIYEGLGEITEVKEVKRTEASDIVF